MASPQVIVLGSGNVASHLLEAFVAAQVSCGLWSRDCGHARTLAARVGDDKVEVFDCLADVPRDSFFYVIAVSDNAVAALIEELGPVEGVVAHTSGSVPLQEPFADGRYGVFYPLQTFSSDVSVDMSKVPFFVEGNNPAVTELLKELAALFGANAYEADSLHRAQLHLAAVFASNFANSLWVVAEGILKDAGYPLDVLEPLLKETLRKAMAYGPRQAQTGPAARNDTKVLSRQMEELEGIPLEIYRLITELIRSQQMPPDETENKEIQ